MLRREALRLLAAAGVAAIAPQARALSEDAARGHRAGNAACIDMHSHAWRRKSFAGDFREGRMAAAVLVVTSDRSVLTRDGGRLRALGSAPPGHLYAQAKRQTEEILARVRESGFNLVRAPQDVAGAASGVILGYEGGDVLEGDLQRVGELHAEGARVLQLAHYRVNELADIQTEDPVHGGLTPFGSEVVRECNRLGIIVDVAHATLAATEQALRASNRPLVLSHTVLRAKPGRYSRGITVEHARAVATSGGVVGVVPFPSAFATFDDYVTGILRMAEAIGVEHVGISTDMSGIHGSPAFNHYHQYPTLVERLLERGVNPEDIAKISGGNFLRVFKAVASQ